MNYRKKILSIFILLSFAFGIYLIYMFGKTFFWDNTIFQKSKVNIYIYEGDDFEKVISVLPSVLAAVWTIISTLTL